MQGGHYTIGKVHEGADILICEGIATGKTLQVLSGMPVVVAFNAGNLREVAELMAAVYPDRAVYIAGDNDHQREAGGKPNVGREKAEQAAEAIGSVTLLPPFAKGEHGSDWNDLAALRGMEVARSELRTLIAECENVLVPPAREAQAERPFERSRSQGRQNVSVHSREDEMER